MPDLGRFTKRFSSKGRQYLTILTLPGDSTRARQFKIPLGLYKGFRYLALPIAGIVGYVLFDYGAMLVRMNEAAKLKRENVTQKIELQTLSAKINELESHLQRLAVFDKKIRTLSNTGKPPKGETIGAGGPAPETFPTLEGKKEDLLKKMRADLDQLSKEVTLQEKSFSELEEFFLKRSSILSSTPSVWPTRGWVTSLFGRRVDPFTGQAETHEGIDISNRPGTPVIATANGIVTKVSIDPYLGKNVEINHGYGMKTIYGHLSAVYVPIGRRVKRGEKIAAIGNTGRSTGSHLHYEVIINGTKTNPTKYILD
jgi:murein DD-endopeptidase MepM/ murein hydrolase activator NlpD